MSGTAGGHALINNKGSALLKFTSPFTATGSGAKTLYADQDNALGSTEFAGSIPDSAGGATALNKNGLGTLILSTANTFTGGVSIKGGTLRMAHVSSIAAGDIKFVTGGTGSGVLQMAYSGTNTTLGNLFLQTSATINLGTTPGASLNFGSATGWTAGAILTVSNSSIGKLYITNTNGVALDQIKSAEDPSATASLTADGLLTFTSSSTPYSTWLSYYPNITNFPGGTNNTTDTADPDGDSFNNNTEFAFDGDPTVGSPSLITSSNSGSGNVAISYVRRKASAGGAAYFIQGNPTLTNAWTNYTPATIITNANGTNGIALPDYYERNTFEVPANGKNFYRVNALVE
jgi:autotransporter-associated beta strand protein